MKFWHVGRAALVTLCASALFATHVRADFTNHPLPGNSAGLEGFIGSTHFVTSGGGKTLDVNVDYAVFAPHTFPRGLENFLPYSSPIGTFGPPDPDDYVYAYQIYNNGPAGDRAYDTLIFLSVGIDTKALVGSLGRDPGFDPSEQDIDAAAAFLGKDGAKYLLIFGTEGQEIGPQEFSMVFLLSSPNAPKFESSYVWSGGALTKEGLLPSPLPTPGAGMAGFVGLMGLVGWKLTRRHR